MMENDISFYRWGKVRNGLSSFAMVNIDVKPNLDNKNEIIENYSGSGFLGQGYIEDVAECGYHSWKIAARQGLEYAFSLTETYWTINILGIKGRVFTDTTPTVVGYTMIRAFCDKIKSLNENKIAMLEDFVFSCWTKPYKELIPDFLSLTFTEYTDNEKQ